MTDFFSPSAQQAQAIRKFRFWYQNRTYVQPVFRVFGYAGTGKTTITRHAIAELGLNTMTRAPDGSCSITGDVLYLARVYDSGARPSEDAVSVTTNQASALAFTPVDDLEEEPAFAGVKDYCEIVSGARRSSGRRSTCRPPVSVPATSS